jgi:hypothetical protein
LSRRGVSAAQAGVVLTVVIDRVWSVLHSIQSNLDAHSLTAIAQAIVSLNHPQDGDSKRNTVGQCNAFMQQHVTGASTGMVF